MISSTGSICAGMRRAVCTLALLPALAAAAPTASFAPSKILPSESYRLYLDVPDGSLLDYEARIAEIDLSAWEEKSGEWGSYVVNGGYVDIPAPPGGFDEGIYIVRYKVRGAAASEFSNWDCLMIDAQATMNPAVTYTAQSIALPPLGAYMILENTDELGNFIGYTRIDIETDPCDIVGSYTMRFTKTGDAAYWGPSNPYFLRWCVREDSTPAGPILLSPGGTTCFGDDGIAGNGWLPLLDMADRINVTYDYSSFGHTSTQGLLGSYMREYEQLRYYPHDSDLYEYYSILPPNRGIPNLVNPPMPVVELIYGYPWITPYRLNTWHNEVIPTTRPDGALHMRYVEVSARLEPDNPTAYWGSVTEDWEWRADGLLGRIRQWRSPEPLCWRGTYSCISSATFAMDAQLFDYYIPDNQPFTMSFIDVTTGLPTDRLVIPNGDPYTVYVTKPDGTPYSGFLEVQTAAGTQTLWRDSEKKAIYFSDGTATISAAAYGGQTQTALRFAARPYLVNSSVNAMYPAYDADLVPNASTAAFSNEVGLFIGVVPPDFDQDTDVDATDLAHLVNCDTGPAIPISDPTCENADLDFDGDADQADFALFQRCFSGTGNPAALDCVNP